MKLDPVLEQRITNAINEAMVSVAEQLVETITEETEEIEAEMQNVGRIVSAIYIQCFQNSWKSGIEDPNLLQNCVSEYIENLSPIFQKHC